MAQYPSTPPASAPVPRPVPPAGESGMNVKRVVILVTAALVVVFVILFVAAVLLSAAFGHTIGGAVEIIRDLVIIFLALEGILIILALGTLIFQVARLINLLQNEVKPVLTDTRETMRSARGTVEFVGDTVSTPLIKASAFFAGVGALVSNVGGIRKALEKTAEDVKEATYER
jgi:hypothetical protein